MGPELEKARDAVEMDTPAWRATVESVGFVVDIASLSLGNSIDGTDRFGDH